MDLSVLLARMKSGRPSCGKKEPLIQKTTACRQLFGEVDHFQIQKDLRKEMEVLDERSKCKWNFDFSKETPLMGRYCWEKVEDDDQEVPCAYEMTHLRLSSCSQHRTCTLPASEYAAVEKRNELTVTNISPSERPTELKHTLPRKRKRQTKISEFYRNKKSAEPPSSKRRRLNRPTESRETVQQQ